MRILVGILLIVVGVVLLFGIIVLPVLPPLQDNATIDTYLAALLCKPNEKMVREQYQTQRRDGTSYSMTPYCVNSERQPEDVTGMWVLIGAGGFVVPFLIGLFLLIIGIGSAARRQTEKILQAIPTYSSGSNVQAMEFHDGVLKVGGFELKLDGLAAEKMQALKAQIQSGAAGGDLTTKLRELQEARDNGLITSSEYDRMRQKILDDVT